MTADKYLVVYYLKKKYGKEFVVNKVGSVSSYYGAGKEWVVYPKDDPDLKFNIIHYYSGGIFRNHPSYMEHPPYMDYLWTKQKREEIKAILKNDLVSVGICSPYLVYLEELYGRTISVKEAEQQFKNEIFLFITCGLLIDFTDFNSRIDDFNNIIKGNLSQKQAENLYDIIRKLKNQNYGTIELKIRYFNSKYEKQIKEHQEWYLYCGVSHFEDVPDSEKGMLLCSIRIRDINKINRPEDVKRFIDLEAGYLYHADLKDQN